MNSIKSGSKINFLLFSSIDDDRKSRHSGENGRESGYGTAPSRLWNSPRLIPRFRYVISNFFEEICEKFKFKPLVSTII